MREPMYDAKSVVEGAGLGLEFVLGSRLGRVRAGVGFLVRVGVTVSVGSGKA